jgi:hypothetical protein
VSREGGPAMFEGHKVMGRGGCMQGGVEQKVLVQNLVWKDFE